MKPIHTIIICFAAFLVQAQEQTSQKNDSQILDGIWVVDLRPSPDAAPYLKEFVVTVNNDRQFSGSFYDTPFTKGRMNTYWECTYFAFETKDQNNTYYHTGYILDDKMHGMTYCPNREFVIPWTGTKKENSK